MLQAGNDDHAFHEFSACKDVTSGPHLDLSGSQNLMPTGSGSPCTDPSLSAFDLIIDVATRQVLVVIIPCGRVCMNPIVQSDKTAMAAFNWHSCQSVRSV
jgi:hypothetical protein